MNLNTIFLGIIATVALGAAVVWWGNQPSAADRRQADFDRHIDKANAAVDRMRENSALLRAADGN